jgi:tetratricopeptide (TPR) repeat protein
MHRTRCLAFALAGLLLLAAPALTPPVLAQEAEQQADSDAAQSAYGQTDFPTSGAEEAQAPFLRGLLMLHSFEYVDARQAFQKAQEIDPDFAMAVWGEAMTHNHPIWMEQDREAAVQALAKLGDTPEAQLAKAGTEREKDYLRTLHVLYGVGEDDPMPKEKRDDAYEEAMAELAASYPDDLDAQAFHALSILGTAHEGRDFETYMRAAAIVEEVFDANPKHPGAAHYLIHAYDDPVHAPLGLRPARVYAELAPSASHALHMPSHIFFALGMWDRGAASNVDSYEAARQTTEARGEGLNGHGFHALHWLHYARLQQGRYADARSVFDTARTHVQASDAGYGTYMQWYLPLAYTVETRQWNRLGKMLSAMDVSVDSLKTRGQVTVHAVKGLAAAKQGEVDAAKTELAAAKAALGDEESEALRIQIRQLEGLIAHALGNADSALSHLKTAAKLERERPLDFGPPFPVKPAHELYGEVLLEMDRPAEAQAQFETSLKRYPKRVLSLHGHARAAARAGNADAARASRTALQSIWDEADEEVSAALETLTSDAAR